MVMIRLWHIVVRGTAHHRKLARTCEREEKSVSVCELVSVDVCVCGVTVLNLRQ
jgi:hypothetical protein